VGVVSLGWCELAEEDLTSDNSSKAVNRYSTQQQQHFFKYATAAADSTVLLAAANVKKEDDVSMYTHHRLQQFSPVLRIRIWDPVPFWPLDPGSVIGFFSGSRIPNPYFWELSDNFLGKNFNNSLKFGPNFSSAFQKQNNIQFCEICGYRKKFDFFSPLSFVAIFGSGIRDPGTGNRDPGWVKIRIRDKHPGSATLILAMAI
jgi:hypothetical protein